MFFINQSTQVIEDALRFFKKISAIVQENGTITCTTSDDCLY